MSLSAPGGTIVDVRAARRLRHRAASGRGARAAPPAARGSVDWEAVLASRTPARGLAARLPGAARRARRPRAARYARTAAGLPPGEHAPLPPPHRMAPACRRRSRGRGRPGDSLQGARARGARVREHRQPPRRRPRHPDRPGRPRRRQGGALRGRGSALTSHWRPGRSISSCAPRTRTPSSGTGRASSSSSTGASPRGPSRPGWAAPFSRERLEEVGVAGTTFLTLPADVLLVALCVHGAKHVWERLGWIVDVAELIAETAGSRLGRCARPRRRGRSRCGSSSSAASWRGTSWARHLPEALSRRIAADPRLPALGAHGTRPARPPGSRPPRARRDRTVPPRRPRNVARPARLLPLRDDADRGRLDGGPATAMARAAPLSPAGGAPDPGRRVPRPPLTGPGPRSAAEARSVDQGIRSTLPVVRRPSRSWWAWAASASGNVAPTRSLSSPFWIQPRTSPARRTRSSRDAM